MSNLRQILLDNLLDDLISLNLRQEDLLSLLIGLLLAYRFNNSVYMFIYRFLQRRKSNEISNILQPNSETSEVSSD